MISMQFTRQVKTNSSGVTTPTPVVDLNSIKTNALSNNYIVSLQTNMVGRLQGIVPNCKSCSR